MRHAMTRFYHLEYFCGHSAQCGGLQLVGASLGSSSRKIETLANAGMFAPWSTVWTTDLGTHTARRQLKIVFH